MRRAGLLLLAGSLSLPGGVPLKDGDKPLRLPGGLLSLRFASAVHPAGGETGVDPRETASSVHAALAAACREWSASPGARVFLDLGTTESQKAGTPENVVTFTDGGPFDEGVCDKRHAAACAILTFVPGSGEIRSVSVAFNPYVRHSSVGFPGTADIGHVMLHELGHAFGLDHSALLDAAMNPFVEADAAPSGVSFGYRRLAPDDRLSLAEAYPSPEFQATAARLRGRVRRGGAGLPGAHVMAVRTDGAPVRDTLTGSDGFYELVVQPGRYTLAVEPLDGPVTPSRFTQPREGTEPFPTLAWTAAGGSPAMADTVEAAAGAVRDELDFAIPDGPAANVKWIAPASLDRLADHIALPRGGSFQLVINRIERTGAPEVAFSAPSIAPSGTAEYLDWDKNFPGLVSQRISIPAAAPVGAANVRVYDGTAAALLPGGLRITVNPRVSSAALSGQTVVVAGADLAEAAEAWEPGAFGPPTQLGGVSVRIGDRYAPLLSVSPAEIRAQLPSGLAGAAAEVSVAAGPYSASPPAQLALAPSISAVVHGATFEPGVPAGSWFSVLGSGFGAGPRIWNDADFAARRMPVSLDGVSVEVNGNRVPVSYVSPGQINALAPPGVVEGDVEVRVIAPAGASPPFKTPGVPFAPAFFVFDGGGRKYVAAVHHSDGAIAGPAGMAGVRPVKPGEIVYLYGTGFGPTRPAAPAGELLPEPAALANSVAITIGGVRANVLWGGLSGAGLYQFNAIIPEIPAGNARVIAELEGWASPPEAYLAVVR